MIPDAVASIVTFSPSTIFELVIVTTPTLIVFSLPSIVIEDEPAVRIPTILAFPSTNKSLLKVPSPITSIFVTSS